MNQMLTRLFRSLSSFIFVVATGMISCGEDSAGPEQKESQDPFFAANFIQTFTKVRDCRFSSAHDGHNVEVYINSEADLAYINGTYPFALGITIVKILYNVPDCDDIASYVSMRKGSIGTASQSGDWEWQEVSVDRIVEKVGQLPSCISCHSSCANDRYFTCSDP